MIKLGIIGYPLGHSLSGAMHKAALKYLGIDGNYYILETPPNQLIDRIKHLKIEDFTGFNVTIPLKVWIAPLLNDVDDYANIAGAVNTVVIKENKEMVGYNTDIYGFIEAIPKEHQENLKGKKAAVFGVGGAARAVAVGLAQLGLEEITFYARNTEKALKLKEIIQASFPEIEIKTSSNDQNADLSYSSIFINTTPLGMQGANEEISPISNRAINSLQDDCIVYDLVYRPKVTKLIQLAQKRDLFTLDGTEMLVLQGAKALYIWLEKEAPVDIMREAVLKNL